MPRWYPLGTEDAASRGFKRQPDDTRILLSPTENGSTSDGADDSENLLTWGFSDTEYRLTDDGQVEITGRRYASSGQRLPHLLPWITNLMGVDIPKKTNERHTSWSVDTRANEGFMHALEDWDEQSVTQDLHVRLRHSHGHSQEDVYDVGYGHIKRIPDVVLFPGSVSEVETCMQLAREHGVRLLPYGGGTNVSGALNCPEDEKRLIASVGMKRMSRVLWVDAVNRLAKIEAGAVGRHIAEALAEYGMTIGHEPDSFEFSTLGGWIATKSSGMKKNKYGNIEDIVLDVEMVTYNGVVTRVGGFPPPRDAIGMDMQSLILGSEGSLGIITSAIVKIFPIPQVQRYGSILFKSFGDGLGFMYDLAQTNQAPASVRLVDNGQFQFSQALKPASTGWRAIKSRLEKAYVIGFLKFDPERMVACTVLFEGRASEVKTQEQTVYRLAKSHGGMKAGAENGRRGYEMTFAIAYIRDFAMGVDLIAESFETSCPWTCALELCEGVKQRVRDEHKARGLPGRPFVSARISQVYDTGVTVYFYLAIFAGGVAKPSEAFGELERAARDEILLQGGSLSHHHGVGTLRRKFLPRVLSPGALSVRETVARAIDPDGVFRDLA